MTAKGFFVKTLVIGTLLYAGGVAVDYHVNYDKKQSEIISTLKEQKDLDKTTESIKYNKLENKLADLERSQDFWDRFPKKGWHSWYALFE